VTSLYLYALVERRPDPGVRLGRGLARGALSVVRVGRACAVVENAGVPEPTPESVVAHDRVVRRLTRLFPAVLPFRFGTIASDLATLRGLVAPFGERLDEAFDRVRGATQFTIRVTGPAAPPTKRDPRGGPGTRWLTERLASQRIPEARCVIEATKPWVRETRTERRPAPGQGPASLGTVYQLVAREDVRAWRRALAGALGELPRGVTATVTGGWPPYAFAELV
jgi:hypothetical protein